MKINMSRGYADVRIGIDLDNTIISYDRLFLQLASERGLIPASFRGSKRQIRDSVRSLPQGELKWQYLQAAAYGPAIGGARPADGALAFIREARVRGGHVMIVSHKTPFPNLGTERVNLHDAAHAWLLSNGIVGRDAVLERDVYFEVTRDDKIRRIRDLQCTHFIDDLEEVLNDPAFPASVERMLFSSEPAQPPCSYRRYGSFNEIAHAFAF